jgi:hypothetical protein
MAAITKFLQREGCPVSGRNEVAGDITDFLTPQRILANELLPLRPPYQFPSAVGTDVFHSGRAGFTEGAFIRADHRYADGRQQLAALFTLALHL